jgi:hypothetical protein
MELFAYAASVGDSAAILVTYEQCWRSTAMA